MKVTIENPQGVYEVVILVIGRFGIAFQKFHDCRGDTNCQTSIDVNSDMKPEAKVVAYSIEHFDKQVLFGSAKIYFESFSDNFVSIQKKKKLKQSLKKT